MLKVEENKLVTEANAGTSMGKLFRSCRLLALLLAELPVPDPRAPFTDLV
jgi:hypothetical protein